MEELPQLATERLLLRPFNPSDGPGVERLAGRWEVADTTLAIPRRHFTRNVASGRVMQKLGMRLEGIHRDAFCRWGRFEDVAVYAVLASDWNRAERRAADSRDDGWRV
jgi:hypothetical protein